MNPKLSQLLVTAPTKILINLLTSSNPKYSSKISRETGITPVHVGLIIGKFRELKLVTIELGHLRKTINLTPKGLQLAILLNSIANIN